MSILEIAFYGMEIGLIAVAIDVLHPHLLKVAKLFKFGRRRFGICETVYTRTYLLVQGLTTIVMIVSLILFNLILLDISVFRWVIVVSFVLVGVLGARIYSFFLLNRWIEGFLLNRFLRTDPEEISKLSFERLDLYLNKRVGFNLSELVIKKYFLIAYLTLGFILIYNLVFISASKQLIGTPFGLLA